jgi:hypothetical protein
MNGWQPSKRERHSLFWGVLVVLVLAIPRVLRMLCGGVVFEDTGYLNCAFLLQQGFRSYTEVPLINFPLLEQLLALIFHVFTASILTAEAVTQVTALAVSLLVWRIGVRLGGPVCGAVAALLFASSALVFRYHVFEREYFVDVAVLGASWLSLIEAASAAPTASRCVAVGALLFIALSFKLTAVGASAAVVLYLALAAGKPRAAAIAGGVAGGLLFLSTLAHYLVYGTPFLVDVFLFRLVRAPFHSWAEKLGQLQASLDFSVALGLAGLAWTALTRPGRFWALPVLQVLATSIVVIVLNPTVWPHYLLELLPWLTLMAGNLVADVSRSLRRLDRRRARAVIVSVGLGCTTLAFAAFGTKGRRPWTYGFGGRPRDEISRLVAYVSAHSLASEKVAVPSLMAFGANRNEAIPYAEITGTLLELQHQVAAVGYRATYYERMRLPDRYFWREVASARQAMMSGVRTAVARREIPVVIELRGDIPVAYYDFTPHELRQSGYVPSLVTEHYIAWTPSLPIP